jgi:hypothetical protein
MWSLVKTDLAYWRTAILTGYGLALVIATLLCLETPPEQASSMAILLLLGMCLFIPYYVVIGSILRRNCEEKRLGMHLLLPLSALEVGVARVLVAIGIWLIGFVLAGSFVIAMGYLGFAPVSVKSFLMLNTLVFLYGQVCFLGSEGRARSRFASVAWPLALTILLALGIMAPPLAAQMGSGLTWERLVSSPLRLVLFHLAAPAVAMLNIYLFRGRRHFLN